MYDSAATNIDYFQYFKNLAIIRSCMLQYYLTIHHNKKDSGRSI